MVSNVSARRLELPDFMTLKEAARALTEVTGSKWRARDVLGCAERHEIGIVAPIYRAAVDTETAAYHLNRRPHTLRSWACAGTYPPGLRPLRVMGRLAWPVAGIRAALGVSAPDTPVGVAGTPVGAPNGAPVL